MILFTDQEKKLLIKLLTRLSERYIISLGITYDTIGKQERIYRVAV